MIAVWMGLDALLWSLGISLWRGRASGFPDIPGFADSFPGSADKIPVSPTNGNSSANAWIRDLFHWRLKPLPAESKEFPVLFPSNGNLAGRSAAVSAELDIAEGVDAGIEEAADDGRGFVLDDDCGAGDDGAGQQVAALVDRHVDELAGLGVEDRAMPRLGGDVGLGRWRGGGGFGRRWGGEEQYPAEDFDLDPRDDAAVEAAVGFFEGGAE